MAVWFSVRSQGEVYAGSQEMLRRGHDGTPISIVSSFIRLTFLENTYHKEKLLDAASTRSRGLDD